MDAAKSQPESLLQEAAARLAAGQHESSSELAAQALALDPKNAIAMHILGWAAHQAGNPSKAIHWLQSADSAAPDNSRVLNSLGVVLLHTGDAKHAADRFSRALQIDPFFIDAALNLGNSLRELRRWPDACAAYSHAAALNPSSFAAHLGLGIAQREAGQLNQSLSTLHHALKLRPDASEAMNSLGMTFQRLDRAEDALNAFARAASLDPRNDKAIRNRAALLWRIGRHAEAIDACLALANLGAAGAADHYVLGMLYAQSRQPHQAVKQFQAALAKDATHAASQCNLGLALEDLGRREEAVTALRKARELGADPSLVDYHLAAMGAAAPPAICPPQYLVQLFDHYSPRFDQHLVERLHYRGPEILMDAVSPFVGGLKNDVIDLGCGTGLCGVLFRPIARRLVGVDLSPRMVEESRRRGVYDEVLESQLTPALASRPLSADLILAADVFIYVGDLAPVFSAAAGALKPGGLFAFTLEVSESADFELNPSRRYAHSLAYIRRVAENAGLQEVKVGAEVLRAGEEAPVVGSVVVLARPRTA